MPRTDSPNERLSGDWTGRVLSNAGASSRIDACGIEADHDEISSCLTRLIFEGEGACSLATHEALLADFFARLVSHHAKEEVHLSQVRLRNWQVHIALHNELASITEDILKRLRLEQRLDVRSLEVLLALVERHVLTFDADLIEAMK